MERRGFKIIRSDALAALTLVGGPDTEHRAIECEVKEITYGAGDGAVLLRIKPRSVAATAISLPLWKAARAYLVKVPGGSTEPLGHWLSRRCDEIRASMPTSPAARAAVRAACLGPRGFDPSIDDSTGKWLAVVRKWLAADVLQEAAGRPQDGFFRQVEDLVTSDEFLWTATPHASSSSKHQVVMALAPAPSHDGFAGAPALACARSRSTGAAPLGFAPDLERALKRRWEEVLVRPEIGEVLESREGVPRVEARVLDEGAGAPSVLPEVKEHTALLIISRLGGDLRIELHLPFNAILPSLGKRRLRLKMGLGSIVTPLPFDELAAALPARLASEVNDLKWSLEKHLRGDQPARSPPPGKTGPPRADLRPAQVRAPPAPQGRPVAALRAAPGPPLHARRLSRGVKAGAWSFLAIVMGTLAWPWISAFKETRGADHPVGVARDLPAPPRETVAAPRETPAPPQAPEVLQADPEEAREVVESEPARKPERVEPPPPPVEEKARRSLDAGEEPKAAVPAAERRDEAASQSKVAEKSLSRAKEKEKETSGPRFPPAVAKEMTEIEAALAGARADASAAGKTLSIQAAGRIQTRLLAIARNEVEKSPEGLSWRALLRWVEGLRKANPLLESASGTLALIGEDLQELIEAQDAWENLRRDLAGSGNTGRTAMKAGRVGQFIDEHPRSPYRAAAEALRDGRPAPSPRASAGVDRDAPGGSNGR